MATQEVRYLTKTSRKCCKDREELEAVCVTLSLPCMFSSPWWWLSRVCSIPGFLWTCVWAVWMAAEVERTGQGGRAKGPGFMVSPALSFKLLEPTQASMYMYIHKYIACGGSI